MRAIFGRILIALAFFIVVLVTFCEKVAQADVFDDLSNSTFSGYVMWDVDGVGKQETMFENITTFIPKDEKLFGIPFTFGRLKVTTFGNDVVIDDILLMGEIGQSDTFYLSYRKLDEPFDVNAGGILYDVARHWWGVDAPPVYLGLYMMEGGDPLYTLYGEYEIATGYFVGVDVLLGMENFTNRDFLDGKVWGKHNFTPEGTTYGEVFVYNISGQTYYGGGVGFSF